MIYTITLNPAIDLVIITKKLEPNIVNRTENFELQPNGKGVNVSFILKKIGIENVATGIGGGFTLDYIRAGLKEKDISSNFLKVNEPTRINVFTRVLDQNREYKEVNPGPEVDEKVQEQFLEYLKTTLKERDTLSISGSFSKGIKQDYLVKIAEITADKKVKLVIDSSSKAVLDTLPYHPYLLKPNDQELASFFDLNEKLDQEKIIKLARKLIDAGCKNVLVSLGEWGAALIDENHAYFGNAPKISVINTAGAGDTMLGTFIGKKELGCNTTEALKFAIAAGSDTASRMGLTDFELEKYLNEIHVSEVK